MDGEPSTPTGRSGSNGSHPPKTSGREARSEAEAAVETLLRSLGQDPARPGLEDTPRRVVDALHEMTEGYERDPEQILSTVFDDDHEELVTVRDIEFTSLCEHHLLPIRGRATVAYLPDGEVVGLSKLSRLVQAFAQRLQVQERMTRQIADAIEEHLAPRGVGVVLAAEHDCMSLRGVETPAEMVTSTFRGAVDEDPTRRRLLASVHGDREAPQ